MRISKAKAYRMMQDREIPVVRMRRTARVRVQDVEALIKGYVVLSK
jgi:excisionase family DNA binding protein